MAEGSTHICYVSPPGTVGGGEISLLHLVSNLSGPGYRPVVVTYGAGELVDRLQERGIEVRTFTRGGRLSELTLIFRLAAFFKRRRIRVVHVNMLDIRAGLAARLAGCTLIGHLRVIFPTTWVDRLFVRLSHRCIAVSEVARQIFASGRSSLYKKFSVIPNGVYLESVSPTDFRGELDLPSQSVLVGALGRIDPFKGFEHFIGAAPCILEKIPEARFLIVGRPGNEHEEHYAQNLKAQAKRLDLEARLFFLGFRPNGLSVIAGFDILVVPSVVLEVNGQPLSEGFGRVAAEAMGVGTPVIASDAGGLPEVLGTEGAGVLVPPANARALADAVCDLLQNAPQRASLVEAGKDRFERRFTIDQHVKAVTDFYASICQTTPEGRD